MKASHAFLRLFRVPFAALLLCCAITAVAQQSPPAPSKETRENMASAFDQMATCLRSDKEISECRQQMQQSCAKLGKQGCPMMHEGKQGKKKGKPPQED